MASMAKSAGPGPARSPMAMSWCLNVFAAVEGGPAWRRRTRWPSATSAVARSTRGSPYGPVTSGAGARLEPVCSLYGRWMRRSLALLALIAVPLTACASGTTTPAAQTTSASAVMSSGDPAMTEALTRADDIRPGFRGCDGGAVGIDDGSPGVVHDERGLHAPRIGCDDRGISPRWNSNRRHDHDRGQRFRGGSVRRHRAGDLPVRQGNHRGAGLLRRLRRRLAARADRAGPRSPGPAP